MPTLKLADGALNIRADCFDTEITLEEWRAGVRPEAGRFALVLPNDADIAEIADTLPRFAAVILEIPVFKDGRAYSQARLLRERFGYRGEIRARGDVLRDQALFLARVGVDAFDVGLESLDGFLEALGELTHAYQPAADARAPVWRLRASRAAAA